ncbi:MAG: hypothetical protein WA842_15095 [Croceibacterium sp.]
MTMKRITGQLARGEASLRVSVGLRLAGLMLLAVAASAAAWLQRMPHGRPASATIMAELALAALAFCLRQFGPCAGRTGAPPVRT